MIRAIGIYGIALGVHILLHRYWVKRRKVPASILGVYVIGGILVILNAFFPYSFLGNVEKPFGFLPITSCLIYGSLSYLTILLTGNSYLTNQNPATLILTSFRIHPNQTYKEISSQFTKKGLLEGRLTDLEAAHLVKKEGPFFTLTTKGNMVVTWLKAYEWIFGWKVGG